MDSGGSFAHFAATVAAPSHARDPRRGMSDSDSVNASPPGPPPRNRATPPRGPRGDARFCRAGARSLSPVLFRFPAVNLPDAQLPHSDACKTAPTINSPHSAVVRRGLRTQFQADRCVASRQQRYLVARVKAPDVHLHQPSS